MIILLIPLLLFFSCAPLQPVAPPEAQAMQQAQQEEQMQQAQATKATQQPQQTRRKQKTKKTAPTATQIAQSSNVITGNPAWDNVLMPWLGTPYLSGGSTKNGVDCSGFTGSVYMEKERMYLPRTAAEQMNHGQSVDRNKLIVGDLVFFKERGRINHVGIFVGNENFIHASSSRGVMISPLFDGHWKSLYAGARRYL